LRRLLSHNAGTSVTGFPGYPRGSALPTTREVLLGRPPATTAPVRIIEEPGTKVRYSGGGFTIVQQLIEDVTGQDFADALHELVMQPAGMNYSTFKQDRSSGGNGDFSRGHLPDGTEVPGGHHIYPEQAAAGLWTTAADLARFVASLIESWSGSGSLLSREFAREMLSPQAGIYGLGIRMGHASGKSSFWHTGGAEGFRAHLRFSADGRGVVGLANGDDGISLINEVFEGLYDRLGRFGPERRRVRVADVDTAVYLGHYDYRFEAFSRHCEREDRTISSN
jgi:CubicO group peptidase (beta-lactamase class C family)